MSIDRHMTRFKNTFGVSLVELMVAMAISLVVLLAVGTVYFSTKRTYKLQNEFSRMQENALYAFQTLNRDASNAGFVGCNPTAVTNHLNLSGVNAELYNLKNGVYGWEYDTGGAGGQTGPGDKYTISSLSPSSASSGDWKDNNGAGLDSGLAKLVVPGTDVLVINSTSEDEALQPAQDIKSNDTQIQFGTKLMIVPGSIKLLTDCNKADVFVNTAALGSSYLERGTTCPKNSQFCNKGVPWSKSYSYKYARVYSSTSVAYYIGHSNTTNEPALFRYDYKSSSPGQPEELIDGVENMQVLYGVNQGGAPDSANKYVTINNVNKLSDIYAIRISLLMRTTGEIANRKVNNPMPTQYVGAIKATAVQVVPLPDRRLRKVFTTTIALRNMVVKDRNP